MNYDVTGLANYVQQESNPILRRLVLGGDSIARFHKQTGIKGSAKINVLSVNPTLQSGAGCGFEADGVAKLSQRDLNTALIKINMEVCPETIRGKYAEHLLSTNADENALPFEAYLVNGILDQIDKKKENLVWQGDTTATGTELVFIDGLLKIAGADSAVAKESIASGKTAMAGLVQVYLKASDEAKAQGLVIFCDPAIYDIFMLEMVAKNFYHYAGANNSAPDEFVLAGTNAKVVRAGGLLGTKKVFATYAENIYLGVDLENDSEVFKIWFSDDNDQYRIKVLWNMAVNYAFSEDVVLGTFASVPATPAF